MKFKSIKKKILLSTTLLISFSLAIVSLIYGIVCINTSKKIAEKILDETTKTAALAIENNLTATKNILYDLGTTEKLCSTTTSNSIKKRILTDKKEQFGFSYLTVTDENGKNIDGKNISDLEFFNKSINGEIFVSDPTPTSDGKSIEMIVSAPIWSNCDTNGRIIGIVYGILPGETLSDIVGSIKVGDTGLAYIINNKGTTIADEDRSFVLSQENTINESKQNKKLAEMAQIEQKALNGETANGTVYFEGVQNFLHVAPINDTNGWVLGIYVEKMEFMKSAYITAIISTIICLMLIFINSIFSRKFANDITTPIKEMETAVKEIADGNYDITITTKTNDELGLMSDSLNKMILSTKNVINDTVYSLNEMANGNFNIEPKAKYVGIFKEIEQSMHQIISSLNNTLGTIETSAEQVSIGADQVSAGAQALSQGSTEQASSIEELSATIVEISNHIKSNAENAKVASTLSSEASKEVTQGNKYMQTLIEAMSKISKTSDEIAKIIKTVEDIAFQTNILALNAAVEAARAGSAGQGFAVVADEVRNLASKSASAANDTTALIENAIQAVNRGTKIVDETAKSLGIIVENTHSVNENIQKITDATVEQSESISQITLGIEQISAVVQTNSATAEESAAASEELSSQATLLNQLLKKFTIKREEKNKECNEGFDENLNKDFNI